jgi:predicted O-methyltransferase YrrM
LEITPAAIEQYLSGLRPEPEPVRAKMEQLAAERSFPIVGPEVGRLLYILCLVSGARAVLELGSGFGYSAYWFARAMEHARRRGGTVHCSDMSEENRDLALEFLEQAGLAHRVHYHLGDARELLDRLPGPLDIVFNDIDKEGYPEVLEPAVARLRPGGLLVTDNTLWKGRVTDPPQERDETTAAVCRFNRLVAEHPGLRSVVLPLRDGVTVAVKL